MFKGPVSVMCDHHLPGKLREPQSVRTTTLGHVESEHTPGFYDTFATSKKRIRRVNQI